MIGTVIPKERGSPSKSDAMVIVAASCVDTLMVGVVQINLY